MSDVAAASGHVSDDEEITPGYIAPAKVKHHILDMVISCRG